MRHLVTSTLSFVRILLKIAVDLMSNKKAQFSYYGDDDRLVSEVYRTHSQCHVNKPNRKIRTILRTLPFDQSP
ncbi:unnamed protein product [Adineta ricciae]|uniref:Uncharacterized protein n=1 Tax=Adineta ricciae TaxID=249248 RepID=A0A814RA92_ADIRI|nr:unnamed protein product [Adineta ricciae]